MEYKRSSQRRQNLFVVAVVIGQPRRHSGLSIRWKLGPGGRAAHLRHDA